MALVNDNQIKEVFLEQRRKPCYGIFTGVRFFIIACKLLVKRKINFMRLSARRKYRSNALRMKFFAHVGRPGPRALIIKGRAAKSGTWPFCYAKA